LPPELDCRRAAAPEETVVSEAQFQRVCAEAELASGQMRCFDIAGVPVLVSHAKDGWFAVDNICTHAYARLDEGRLRGHRLICPLHGASFDVRTGAVLGAPAVQPLRKYPLRIVDGHVEVELPVKT
jgi:3-phenylpropionate/trans-cinnamate dioxygenase ferredoxin subunit